MGTPDACLGQIIRRYRDGDASAVDEFVRHVQGPLLRLATWILQDAVAAEDAFVESMARLLPLLGEAGDPERFGAYARQAVRNCCVDMLRSRGERDARRAMKDTARAAARVPWQASFVEGLPGAGRNPEQAAAAAQEERMLREAIEELGEPARTIVQLYYRQGLTHQEIGGRLGISDSSVKRTLVAARTALARRLRHPGELP